MGKCKDFDIVMAGQLGHISFKLSLWGVPSMQWLVQGRTKGKLMIGSGSQ